MCVYDLKIVTSAHHLTNAGGISIKRIDEHASDQTLVDCWTRQGLTGIFRQPKPASLSYNPFDNYPTGLAFTHSTHYTPVAFNDYLSLFLTLACQR